MYSGQFGEDRRDVARRDALHQHRARVGDGVQVDDDVGILRVELFDDLRVCALGAFLHLLLEEFDLRLRQG